MEFDRIEAVRLLEQLVPGLNQRGIIAQSDCFVFSKDRAITFNDDVACSVVAPFTCKGAVKAMPMLNLLRKIKEPSMDALDEKGKLIFKGKNKKATLRKEDKVELPVENLEVPKTWSPVPAELNNALRIVQTCASKDETRFNLTCIHMNPAFVEASDSYQFVRFKIKLPLKKAFLVRKDSLVHVLDSDMVDMSETDNWIHFRNETGLVYSCRRYMEKFPDASRVYKVKGAAVVLPKSIKSTCERADVFSSENLTNVVTIKLVKGRVYVDAQGSSGEYTEVGKAKYDGEPFKFTIPPSLLARLVGYNPECRIEGDVLCLDGNGYTYVTTLGTLD